MSLDSSDPLYSDDLFDYFSSPSTPCRFSSPPHVDDAISKWRTLPLELIEYIIELFHEQYRSFSALRSLSVASSQLRAITLRRYMTSLSIYSTQQLTSLSRMHTSTVSLCDPAREYSVFHWVKRLTARSGDLARAPWKPRLMGGLRDLHISFVDEVRSTQKIRLNQIFIVPLANSPMTHLTSLTLTDLWRIDTPLLRMVSATFPGLLSLHLSCSEHLDTSCCWTCFEDSSSTVVHSPIPNHYTTAESLASNFTKALKPLTKLTDLHLGIFLSDEEMLENHIDHYDSPRAYSRAIRATVGQTHNPVRTGTILSQSASPSTPHLEHVSYGDDEKDVNDSEAVTSTTSHEVPPFPHGPELCPICSITVSAPAVRTRELEASLALARKLKSLKTIGWSSFFAWNPPSEDERRIGDWRRATKTYVLRSGGRVRIRRRPWD